MSPAVDLQPESATARHIRNISAPDRNKTALSYIDEHVFRRLRGSDHPQHHDGAHYEPSKHQMASHGREGSKPLASSAPSPTCRLKTTSIAQLFTILLPLITCVVLCPMMPGAGGAPGGAQAPNIGVVRSRNIRIPDPPSWGPDQEAHNPFRRWTRIDDLGHSGCRPGCRPASHSNC